MQVTRAGEYGVLGLICLARKGSDCTAMIDEISAAGHIPKSFLAKVFQSLKKSGLLRSVRGAKGGFALAKAPSEITVLEIIEAIEGRIVFQRCKQEKADCEHVGGCALCGILEHAQDGLREALQGTRLSDLVERQERIEAARANALPPSRSRARVFRAVTTHL